MRPWSRLARLHVRRRRRTSTCTGSLWVPAPSVVRISGQTYEALAATGRATFSPFPMYHSALIATTRDVRVVIEMAPIPDDQGPRTRGVVAEGPVGLRRLRALRTFRYEIRCWRHGEIPDLAYAVDSPTRITADPAVVQTVLDLVPLVPTPVWGRDELQTGDMWNSNSVISWVLTRAGLESVAGRPPANGRAPGWDAGVLTAHRAAATRIVSPPGPLALRREPRPQRRAHRSHGRSHRPSSAARRATSRGAGRPAGAGRAVRAGGPRPP